MKKQRTVTVRCCDVCEKDAGRIPCLGCGKDFCDKCRENQCVVLWDGVFHGGVYCNACADSLPESKSDPLYNALAEMAVLRLALQKLRQQDAELTRNISKLQRANPHWPLGKRGRR